LLKCLASIRIDMNELFTSFSRFDHARNP
jgi:hypothetical protein